MRVNKRKKRDRPNPEAEGEIEVDAFSEEGMVIVQFGESEIAIDPEQADELAELIADAATCRDRRRGRRGRRGLDVSRFHIGD